MKRKLFAALGLIGLLALPLSHAEATTPAFQTTSPVTLMPGEPVVVGSSTLTRTTSGISFTLQTAGLEPGHAVTIWWMVDNPDEVGDAGVAVLYAAGHVIGGSGTATFAGHLNVGDSTGWVMGGDTSLEDALAATVILVVRDHGPMDKHTINDQIHTFDVCNLEPDCIDIQKSVHSSS